MIRSSRVLVLLTAIAFSSCETSQSNPIVRPSTWTATTAVGVQGHVGTLANPKRVQQLHITKPGVYENYLVDGGWINSNLVKINANNVTLRNCEIRNGMHNGIDILGKDVLIESCKIHHMLKGNYSKQLDAHGIDGRPTKLTIRNCEIYMVSGDSVQFDPDRGPWDDVLIENCTFWTGPLESDAAGFKKGERPGENAVDTKQNAKNPRSRMTIRNCLFYGWGQGQIQNQAALNLKNNVQVAVENCVFRDNDICFRVRGPGKHGGALVTIMDCALYRSKIGARVEDKIQNLKIYGLAFGKEIGKKYLLTGGGYGAGHENIGEFPAPKYEEVLKRGVKAQRALIALKKLGASLVMNSKDRIVTVDLSKSNVTDSDLIHLKRLPSVRVLVLNHSITDKGLAHLKEISTLEGLNLAGSNISNAGIEHLQGLTHLKKLSLGQTRVSDLGLVYLEKLTSLELLYLPDTQVTDTGLEHIQGLTNLESLHLSHTQISDAGLKHLKGLTKLRRLALSGTQITDSGLKLLAGLTRLERLYLSHTQITDVGLVQLEGLTSLEQLRVVGSKVTTQGIQKLRQALPKTKIND